MMISCRHFQATWTSWRGYYFATWISPFFPTNYGPYSFKTHPLPLPKQRALLHMAFGYTQQGVLEVFECVREVEIDLKALRGTKVTGEFILLAQDALSLLHTKVQLSSNVLSLLAQVIAYVYYNIVLLQIGWGIWKLPCGLSCWGPTYDWPPYGPACLECSPPLS